MKILVMNSLLLIAPFLSLFCRSSAVDDNLREFEKLSDLNKKWLQAISVPEMAMVLQHPPYTYRSEDVLNNSTVSDIVLSRNESQMSSTERSCSDDLVQVLFNLGSDWALQMLDSDGKLSSGVLRGSISWPGHFDECHSVYAPKDSKGHGDFHGKYCATTWTVNLSKKFSKLPLTVGLCVPDSCSEDEIKGHGGNLLGRLKRLPGLKKYSSALTLEKVSCKLKEKSMDLPSIIYLVLMFCFLSLTVIGSVVAVGYRREKSAKDLAHPEQNPIGTSEANSDVITPNTSEATSINSSKKNYQTISLEISQSETAFRDKDSLTRNPELGLENISISSKKLGDPIWKRILLCFSAFENGEKILNTDKSEGQLLSIHGIRFLSLSWVILGHTYITSISIVGNRLDVLKEMDTFPFQVLLQSPFSVDSFFLLSGFLLAYLFLKEADKNGKINWLYFYLHRLWRLTPVYLVVVFFYIYVFKYMGSGPFWNDNNCDAARSTWWKYLLYINNFIPIRQMCVGWSWYLANDMQFYLISPLFLYPLWRWPVIGFSLLASILIGTWTTTAVLSYTYDLIPMFVGVTHTNNFIAYADKMWDSFDLIYDKPYCRIAPYIIGVILGFMLYKVNQRKNFLSVWQQALGWSIAVFCSLSVMFGLYHIEMSRTTSLFYNTLCRSSFSVGLAWLIFACETGHGGFITKLLSWKAIIPLSRLTYCAYLVHPILIHGYYKAYQTEFFFTELVMVTNGMGFIFMSFGLAFLLSITFESPLMNLEKLLLKSKRK